MHKSLRQLVHCVEQIYKKNDKNDKNDYKLNKFKDIFRILL